MAESDRSLNTSMYSPGENTRSMGILEEKICAFLERKGAGAQLKALEIAKGVGLTTAKDVNKALYNLQGKGCLQKGGDTSPLWSLAGSSVSTGVNYLPNPTGTPSKHGMKEILRSRTGVKELPNPTGTPSKHGMKEILKSRTGAGGEGVRAKELARDLDQPKSAVNAQLYAMLSRGEVKLSRTSEGGSSFWMSTDEYGSSNSKKDGKDSPDSMRSTAASRFQEEFSSIKKLGQGGFGSIYLAKGKIDETDYAIKVVKFDMHASREVKALALFQHPNIVRYHAAWKEESLPQSIEIVGSSDWGCESESKDISTKSKSTPMMYLYIQMEFCGMGTLTQWIAKRNNGVIRSKEEALNVFQKIVDGVKYVHSRQHIHRDLKPDNILFGSDGTVKIGDFGLVTKITSGNGASIERTMGTGTPSYMSPEQDNESTYDEKVDIFPLGLIFFEVLWRIGTGMERAKLWEGLRRGELPEEFRKEYTTEHLLIRKMLSEAPENRPGAEDIAKQLSLLLEEKTFLSPKNITV